MEVPITRYATTRDDVHIAYQVFGGGTNPLVIFHPWVSHVEIFWELPGFRRLAEGFGRQFKVIHFDKRGVGLSDRIASIPTFEARVDDVLAVLDALHLPRAALYGYLDGAALAAAFAATHPGRTSSLVLQGDTPFRVQVGPDNPGGMSLERFESDTRLQEAVWGDPSQGAVFAQLAEGPDSMLNDDPAFGPWWAKMMRYGSAPGDVRTIDRIWFETDASSAIEAIQVPTALYFRTGWPAAEIEAARELTARIPGACLIEVPGAEYAPWGGHHVDELTKRLGTFLSDVGQEEASFDRVLATVLFTDMAGSTERLAAVGDAAWKRIVEEHHRRARTLLARYRGREVDTAGDGFFAVFDGPGRAVKCALTIVDAMRDIGIDVRAALHTGEVEEIDGKVGGLAVNIGARVAGVAVAGEVLVSSTVRDLVAGSGLKFNYRGSHELKGIPGTWQLYRASPG